jgi:hypothetical protein
MDSCCMMVSPRPKRHANYDGYFGFPGPVRDSA